MRNKVAYALRKWADLIDPIVRPSCYVSKSTISIELECDTDEVVASLEQVKAMIVEINALADRLKKKIPIPVKKGKVGT